MQYSKGEKGISTIIVRTDIPKDYRKAEKEHQWTTKIVKLYFRNLEPFKDKPTNTLEKDLFGVRVEDVIGALDFYLENEEWNSPNHIHLLTDVQKLVIPDVMGKD